MNPLLSARAQQDIILASRSPRRRDILESLQFDFEVHPASDEAEQGVLCDDAERRPLECARAKAREVAERFPDATVIGADTIVLLNGRILEKPQDDAEARSFLALLSGATHTVISGVVVLQRARGVELGDSARTRVTFRRLSDEEITRYVASGEGRDKAGAYAVQGLGAGLVRSIDGCFYNVVGLPVGVLFDLLEKL